MTDAIDMAYPRPQLRRADWVDLHGRWDFAHDDANVGLGECWQDRTDAFTRKITVPFPPESELSGICDRGFHPVVWYRRTFDAARRDGHRLLLHFGAVDHAARVWVNGHLVAQHEGGMTPFSADITEALDSGGVQVVTVRAEDRPEDVTQPRGKQDWQREPHAIWYHRTTGIWQPVWLEPVPEVHVEALHIVPDPARCLCQIGVDLSRPPPEGATVEARLTLSGRLLALVRVAATGTGVQIPLHLPALENGQARQALLWSPESPTLIDLTLTVADAEGRPLDSVESYVGLRSCGTGRGRFLLNDRPYFLRAVLEQGYWPQSHLAAPDAEALRREVEMIKALGFNAVRVHQKVEDPRFLHLCDRLGLLVWGEMANAYAFSPRAVERLTRAWLEVVRRDRNHPCIVTWVPLNESWGVADIALRADQKALASALYHLCHALDPTRPVVSNDGWEMPETDIVGVHDYAVSADHLRLRWGRRETMEQALAGGGPQRRRPLLDPATRTGQPVMITEFGGISHVGADRNEWHGYATVATAADYQAAVAALFDALHDCPDIAGYCYTQLTDTLQERNGLLTESRQPKLPVEIIRRFVDRPSAAVPAEHLDHVRRRSERDSAAKKTP